MNDPARHLSHPAVPQELRFRSGRAERDYSHPCNHMGNRALGRGLQAQRGVWTCQKTENCSSVLLSSRDLLHTLLEAMDQRPQVSDRFAPPALLAAPVGCLYCRRERLI